MSAQPFYTLDISSSDCHFNLFVNDIPLLRFNKGGNISTELPLNAFLLKNPNKISCEILPIKGQATIAEPAKVKISIIEGSIDGRIPGKSVASFQAPSFVVSKTNPPKQAFKMDGSFAANIVSSSQLENGLSMVAGEKLKTELFEKYQKLHQLFKEKDIAGVMKAMALKNAEYAAATGQPLSDVEYEMRKDYTAHVNDASYELWEFTPDKVFLKLYNNNRLACLEVQNGNQPLCFVNRTDHIAMYLPVYFFRNPKFNTLEVIR
jgi:hypothetical protein